MKSDMADHVCGNQCGGHQANREKHWAIRHLNESAHILGTNNLVSRPSIEIGSFCESLIKKGKPLENVTTRV